MDCAGGVLEDDAVGGRISERGGRIPVAAALEVVGRTIFEDGGRVPVGRCATGLLVASSVSVGAWELTMGSGVLEVVGRTISEDAGKPTEGCWAT